MEGLIVSSDARLAAIIEYPLGRRAGPNAPGRLKVWDVSSGKLVHTRVIDPRGWSPSRCRIQVDADSSARRVSDHDYNAIGATRAQIKAPKAYSASPESRRASSLADQRILTETSSNLTILNSDGSEPATLPVGELSMRGLTQWGGDRTLISVTKDAIELWTPSRKVRFRIPSHMKRGHR